MDFLGLILSIIQLNVRVSVFSNGIFIIIVPNRPYTCVFAVQIGIIIIIIIAYYCNYFRGSLFSDWPASFDQVLAGFGSLSVVSVTCVTNLTMNEMQQPDTICDFLTKHLLLLNAISGCCCRFNSLSLLMCSRYLRSGQSSMSMGCSSQSPAVAQVFKLLDPPLLDLRLTEAEVAGRLVHPLRLCNQAISHLLRRQVTSVTSIISQRCTLFL